MKRRTRKKQVGRIRRDMRRGDRWWQGWHLRWVVFATAESYRAFFEKGNGT